MNADPAKQDQRKNLIKILILALAVIGLAAVPLLMVKDGQFRSTDDQAEELVAEISAGYRPWFSSLWKPAGQAESLLFAIQAAIGAGVVGYGLGFMRGRKKKEETDRQNDHQHR